MSGVNPDFSTQQLFETIENGTYPGWTLFAQVLTPEQAQRFKYNVLDLTKYVLRMVYLDLHLILIFPRRRDWGFDDVPRTEIGKFYLTENPAKLVSLKT